MKAEVKFMTVFFLQLWMSSIYPHAILMKLFISSILLEKTKMYLVLLIL